VNPWKFVVGIHISKPSWVEKVTGDKSKWFRASKLEKEGKVKEAVKLYLEEAKEQKSKNPGLAGLCYLSAAKSLMKAGKRERAMPLFMKAAESYASYAERVLAVSPSSAIWGYKMASRCYAWAGEYSKAEEMRGVANSLSEKVKGGKEEYPLFRVFRPRKGEK